MHYPRDGDDRAYTKCRLTHGNTMRRSMRKWSVGTKLMMEEIRMWKALARFYGIPMNAVLVRALQLLFDQKPVPLE